MNESTPTDGVTLAQYREYILRDSSTEGERLVLQHSIFQARFEQIVKRVLDEYGLAQRLSQPAAPTQTQTKSEPVRILDVGCGEGLYLHDVAHLLESRGLFEPHKVEFIGIDLNSSSIATAQEFARLSKPARPYLEFFTHDLTTPFASNVGLAHKITNLDRTPQFDFIYCVMVMEHIPNAQVHLSRLYELLKPGGIIYLRDFDTAPPPSYYTNSALGRFLQIFNSLLSANNKGEVVAFKSGEWLSQLGAVQVEVEPHVIRSGGTSKEGILLLKDLVYLVRTASPVLVRLGLLSEPERLELIQSLFEELSPQSEADVTFVDTLARKAF